MRRRWVDAVLVAAACALALAVAVDALRGSSSHGRPRAPAVPPAAVPDRVALRGSPETAFLPRCAPERLRLAIATGPRLVLRYRGGRCHLARLELRATVRDDAGTIVYEGAAVEPGALAGNLAGAVVLTAPLLPRELRCRLPLPLRVRVAGAGLAAGGTVRCRGEL
jgi:hypothetical protein